MAEDDCGMAEGEGSTAGALGGGSTGTDMDGQTDQKDTLALVELVAFTGLVRGVKSFPDLPVLVQLGGPGNRCSDRTSEDEESEIRDGGQ